jgi:hypothetical protein
MRNPRFTVGVIVFLLFGCHEHSHRHCWTWWETIEVCTSHGPLLICEYVDVEVTECEDTAPYYYVEGEIYWYGKTSEQRPFRYQMALFEQEGGCTFELKLQDSDLWDPDLNSADERPENPQFELILRFPDGSKLEHAGYHPRFRFVDVERERYTVDGSEELWVEAEVRCPGSLDPLIEFIEVGPAPLAAQ